MDLLRYSQLPLEAGDGLGAAVLDGLQHLVGGAGDLRSEEQSESEAVYQCAIIAIMSLSGKVKPPRVARQVFDF